MSNRIWSDEPLTIDETVASKLRGEQNLWEQTVYPVGNGRLGGTVFGVPSRERFQFNQDSLWVGNEDNTGAYQPFGDIIVELPHEEYQAYRRELDLDRAVQTIRYEAGGVTYQREFLASYPAQIVGIRFSADKAGSLSGRVSMTNIHEIAVRADGHDLVMQGDTRDFWYWQFMLEHPERLIADRQYASDQIIPLDFEARVRVLHEGGRVHADGDAFVLEDVDSLTLLLAADTNYMADREQGWHGKHPHERLCELLDNASRQSWDSLVSEHVADYQSIFCRMQFSLGDTPPALTEQTTEARLDAYRATFEAGRPVTDHALEALFYAYARYLLISSSRPGYGALPTNLQGIWSISKKPSWRCDFHTDINIQMNYWFADGANLSDCFEPFFRWIDSIRDVRKEETRRVLGVERGWLMRSENGIFGGSTWHIQKGDSAWLCQNLWDHYTFTKDNAYLERYAYPVMKEISEFWIDHLKALPDGRLVAPEGRSPEHGPVGVDGVTYDQQLCSELFDNTLEAAKVLDVDADFQKALADKRSRLLGPQIGRWGQFQEWMEDIDDPKDDHRHINHMIGVYPGSQVDPVRTPELAVAARTSLEARRDYGEGHPGWSRVWKACMFARLMDGESAYGQLSETLATHVYGNLWAVHPPFQIDANFGFAAAVNEMLVQSHAGFVHLLPALPQAWSSGSVKGMRVRGGYSLDMTWADGRLTSASLSGLSTCEGNCDVRYGDQQQTIRLAAGEQVALNF